MQLKSEELRDLKLTLFMTMDTEWCIIMKNIMRCHKVYMQKI